jgi:hypothetical protein
VKQGTQFAQGQGFSPAWVQKVVVGEATLAVGTWVGLLPSVSTLVDHQRAPLAEATPTVRAWIGLFPGVEEPMLEQVLGLREIGLALATGERPLPSVDLLVAG